MKETELYGPVKKWLEHNNYTVYPEVESFGSRADIVAVKQNTTLIVELKTSLSLEVISQGVSWKHRSAANYVYLAVPAPRKEVHWYASKLIKQEKLGLLLVDPNSSYRPVREYAQAIWEDVKDNNRYSIGKAVTPEHLDWDIEGGHSGGGYLTSYRSTITRVKNYLAVDCEGKWCLMKDIIANCPTHYTGDSPGQSLGNALEKFESDWCEVKVINRKKHFRVKGASK